MFFIVFCFLIVFIVFVIFIVFYRFIDWIDETLIMFFTLPRAAKGWLTQIGAIGFNIYCFFNDTCISARTSWMRYCLKNGPLQVTTHVSIITTNLVSPPLALEFVTLSKVKCQRNVLRQLQKLTNMAIDITTIL